MRKLRFTIILPSMQVTVAAILLQWGYRTQPPGVATNVPPVRLICMGLNAPAMLFNTLDPLSWGEHWDWGPRYLIGFDRGDLFFLFGVAVVWALCGRALDSRDAARVPRKLAKTRAVAAFLVLGSVGTILFVAAVRDLTRTSDLRAPFFFAWALVLILLSLRGFRRMMSLLKTDNEKSPTRGSLSA